MSKERKRQRYRRRKKGPSEPMLLTAYNYKLLVIGVVCVLLGFGGMYIDGQQYGIYSLYIAPLLVMAGFITVATGIFKTDPAILKEEKENKASSDNISTSG